MLLVTFCALVGVIFISFAKLSVWRYKYSKRLPGRQQSFFNILGDLKEIITFFSLDAKYAQILDIMKCLQEKIKMFKDQPLFCFWILYTPLIFLNKAAAVKEVLSKNGLKEKSWIYEWSKEAFGNGLITSPYSIWKPRRKLVNHCFHPDILRNFFPIINLKANELVKFFEANGKEAIDVTVPVRNCAMDVICETAFDVKMDSLWKGQSQFLTTIHRGCEIFMSRIYKFHQWPDFIFWNTPTGREAKFHLKILNDFTQKVINEKKERYLTTENKVDTEKRQALLDVLLHMHLETKELTEEEVKDEVNTFILAGHDTVSLTLSWALYRIGLSLEVQAKIHDELNKVFGDDTDKAANEDDLNQLFYLDCVLKEVLRIYPPVPLFAREPKEDTIICGYTIPKGTSVIIPAYYLHRDEDVFPDPEKFDPDRFSLENKTKIPEFAYIPFSGGPRNCIGYRFAMMELKILITAIFRNFSIETLEEKGKVIPLLQITLIPSTQICIKFTSRNYK